MVTCREVLDGSMFGVVEYAPVLIFLLVAAMFPVVALVIAKIVRPDKPNKVKEEAYECSCSRTTSRPKTGE